MTAPPNDDDDDAAVDDLFQPPLHHSPQEGVWIGVDFGTSNSTSAVWDSANGRAKWIRLPRILAKPQGNNNKKGRIMPSVALFGNGESVYNVLEQIQSASVGQAAVTLVEDSLDETNDDSNFTYSFPQVSNALITSVKRIFGMKPQQLKQNTRLEESLPFKIVYENDKDGQEQVFIQVTPINNSNKTLLVTPLQVTVILLQALRQASQHYLDTEGRKKSLQVPGEGLVRNCVLSVPASYSQAQRKLMQQACRLAGFTGTVSNITESTAASMAYGLFASCSSQRNILVFDMGGGTTDVTICQQDVDATFRVVVTQGNEWLGGDDMDQALLKLVLKKTKVQTNVDNSLPERRRLLQSCRKAKEDFCGKDDEPPVDAVTILVDEKMRVEISKDEFHAAMEPIIQQAQEVVQSALKRFESSNNDNNMSIDEVVLVGGATRVPQVHAMLDKLFPKVELCTSVNVDSAVAQGAAIQAALNSSLIPPHELRSALMLDALPHSIGVQLDNGEFLCILKKDSQLPASGFATFYLANVHQAGVTLTAVEKVGNDLPLEPIGEFTFLLRKLSDEQLCKLGGKRSVDIGMKMETDGKFVVSIFDPNDPEHLAKKRRHEQRQSKNVSGGMLDYHENGSSEKEDDVGITWTRQETQMLLIPILLFVLYVGVKIAFHEPLAS